MHILADQGRFRVAGERAATGALVVAEFHDNHPRPGPPQCQRGADRRCCGPGYRRIGGVRVRRPGRVGRRLRRLRGHPGWRRMPGMDQRDRRQPGKDRDRRSGDGQSPGAGISHRTCPAAPLLARKSSIISPNGPGCTLHRRDPAPVAAGRLLVAAGRTPATEGMELALTPLPGCAGHLRWRGGRWGRRRSSSSAPGWAPRRGWPAPGCRAPHRPRDRRRWRRPARSVRCPR